MQAKPAGSPWQLIYLLLQLRAGTFETQRTLARSTNSKPMKHAAQILYDSFSVRIDSRDAGLVVRLSLGRDQTLRFPLDHEYLAVAPRVRQGMVSTPALPPAVSLAVSS